MSIRGEKLWLKGQEGLERLQALFVPLFAEGIGIDVIKRQPFRHWVFV